ncbi:MAG: BadF/BadG/BcrA/BcrD ATPase family protein [Planctomycetota bacterium]
MAEGGDSVLAVGIDGGGTSTRVQLVDGTGRRLGSGISGSGNLHDVGPQRLAEHVEAAWRDAWAEAGGAPRPADSVFCAMASVGTPGNRETVREVVAGVGVAPLERVVVDIDLVGALSGGLGGGHGIALIAGTGSSCFGRDPSGRTFQSGGWGSLLDDVGSATWLGTEAMVAAVRAFDRRGPATSLEANVKEHFGLAHMRELLPKIDGGGSARATRAQLAPLVTSAAETGDAVAQDLLRRGADALAECVEAVWGTLDFREEPVEVVVTGGLAENVPAYRDLVHAAVVRRVPDARRVLPRASNLVGAAIVALQRSTGGLTEEARARLVGLD